MNTPETVSIIARPHPISTELVRCDFPVGSTIATMVGEARLCRVEIGGMTIPEEWWPRVRPHAGVAVYITRYPQGGSVKSILRIIAFAALAVGVALISAGTGSVFLTAVGDLLNIPTSAAAGLAAAGVGLVGSLVINALIPPTSSIPTSSTASTDTLRSITGTSNQVSRYGAIPCVVGVMRVYPTYAAQPWTELLGDDQYLRCLFDAGYGAIGIADMQIGDSDLSTYTDVETEIDTAPDLFSQDVLEEAVGITMVDGDVDVRTTGIGATEISLDLIFAGGLFGLGSDGNPTATTCPLRIEYVVTGKDNWQTVANASGINISFPSAVFSSDGNLQVNNNQRKAVRVGLRWTVPVGQYDVRVTRYTTHYGNQSTDPSVGNMSWSVLRTIRSSPASSTTTTKVALRIKATDQLDGAISQFNFIGSQSISVWNGSGWAPQVTENPAWIFRWLLRDCPANPRLVDPARIDDAAIIAWAAECDAKEFTFSTVLDQATTLFALLQQVCAAGRASFNVTNGRYSVVRDVAQTVPVQVFTPRNSDAFSGSRAFPDEIHGLRAQFTNPEAAYQQDERIVYDDGFGDAVMVASDPTLQLASKFETFPITGCTNANAAWRLARYHLACLRLRPNTYTWTADIENLICSRGDLVHVANDIIAIGLAWGRIKVVQLDASGNVLSIQTDERVTFEAGQTYAVRVRRSDGTAVTAAVTGQDETQFLAFVTPQTNINTGDLFVFGVQGLEVLPMVITKIEPSTDYSAKITAVDAAPAVLTADAATPPPWSSAITGQPWLDTPAPPVAISVSSSQLLAPPDDAGNTYPVVNVNIMQASRVARVA